METKVTTRELAEMYAERFDDVSVVMVAKNGVWATFRQPNAYGSASENFTMTREVLIKASHDEQF